MKKVRLLIAIIYLVGISLVTVFTVTFVIRSFLKGSDLYFQQSSISGVSIDFNLVKTDLERAITIIKKYNLIK